MIIVSRGLEGVLESAFTLCRISEFLGRELKVEIHSGLGIAYHRTAGIRNFAEYGERVRGLMMDADVRLPLRMAGFFADAIKRADERHANFVSPVRLITGYYNVARTEKDKAGITSEEYGELHDWQRIYAGGLAFYYGTIPTAYRFHEGDTVTGEDWNFFLDNHIPLQVVKLPTEHYKEMLLR